MTKLQAVAVAEIRVSKMNPRARMNDENLKDLVESVRTQGVLQPVLVRALKNGKGDGFELVYGHRRLRAAQLADLTEIPAIVRELSDEEVLEIQLVENLQREGLDPLEEAEGYRQLMTRAKYDVARIAERIGRSAKYVYDRVKLLELVPEAKKLVLERRISAGHAILLARLKPADQKRAINPENSRGFHPALWSEEETLFDPKDDEQRDLAERKDPYFGLKARSVRELGSWIDEHVRFQPKAVDPVLFPETAVALEGAPKVVPITHLNYIPEEAREGRTYGPRSWKRADGKEKSKTCEFATTGFVAIGPQRGDAFAVCVHKDRCSVHWGEQVRARKWRDAQRPATGSKDSPKASAPPFDEELNRALAQAQEAGKHELEQALIAAAGKMKPDAFLRALAMNREYELREGLKRMNETRPVQKLGIGVIQSALALVECIEFGDNSSAKLFGVDADIIYKTLEAKARAELKAKRAAAKKAEKPAGKKKAARKAR